MSSMIANGSPTPPVAASPHPLADGLPALLRDGTPDHPGFLERFCSALDGVLAPVLETLDALEAYVDPDLVPADFLPWMRRWVGLADDLGFSEAASRAFVREAAELYRWHGTERSLRRFVELYSEGEVEVSENGGSLVAGQADTSVRFDAEPPRVHVQVRLSSARARDPHFVRGLRAVVRGATPAHVLASVEVTGT